MPTIVQTVSGKISGLWGSAMVRGTDGKMHALQLGDIVQRGDVILTAQNGIVQLTPEDSPAPRRAPVKAVSDIDRVIADLNEKDPKAAPAAGIAEGALSEGLRVGRVVEGVTPQSFEYAITDRAGNFDIAGTAVEPTIPAVAAVSSAISAVENGQRVGLGLQVPNGTPPTATVVVDKVPAVGQVMKADGTVLAVGMPLTPADLAGLVYVPPVHYANEPVGPFVYTITNGPVSAVGSTQITVAPVNEIPALVDDVATGSEDTPITGNVLRNDTDPDGDRITVTAFRVGGIDHAAGQPAVLAGIGTLVINADGSYLFTPTANYNGPVPVATYTATDGQLTSTATLTLAVAPVNDPPAAGDDIASTPINKPVDIAVLANDKDVDGDVLTVSQARLADPTQGTVSVNPDGTLHFVPATNLTGPVTITYTVTDPIGGTDTATVTVNVGTNTPPDSADKTVTTPEDTPVTLTTADFAFTDADAGQTLNAVRIDTLPTHGTLLLNGAPVAAGTLVSAADIAAGHLSFAPAADGNGAPYAAFTFSVQDSAGAFDAKPNTLTLAVTPVNDPPVAVADTQTTDEDTPVTLSVASLLANDTDADGDPLTLVSVQAPQHGTVAIVGGNVVFTPEPDYNGPASFTYTVKDPSGATSTATVNVNVTPVVDPAISISDVTVNEGAGTATFVVTLSEATTASVSVKYQTGDATATTADYGATNGTLTFAPGVTSQTVTVPIINDTVYERSETFNVTLSQPTNATIGHGTGVGTIVDDGTGPGGTDNDLPTLAVTAANAVEGTAAVFTVTLSNPSTSPVVFTPGLTAGSATLGTDTGTLATLEASADGITWQPVSGNVTIPAGATSVQLRLPTMVDGVQESTENFALTATPVSGAVSTTASAIANIIDIDGPPALSITDVTVNEAAGTMVFTVTLAPFSGKTVTVDFATADGSATAGADYAGQTGTLTFAPNVTTQTIEVKILNDGTFEGSETLNVILSNAVNADVADGLGIGTIRDDGTGPGGSDNDTPQVGSVSSPTVAEGGNLDFAVTLTHPSTTPTTVALTPASGTATLGTDTQPALVSFDNGATFTAVSGPTVTVPAGSTGFIVRVPTVDDGISEPTETLTLAAATPANTAPVVGTGTITDNDGTPALAISGPVLVNEAAGTATFTVTLSVPSSAPVSVNFGTVNGTATAGSDFTAGTGTLTFAPGVTSQTVTVAITDDATFEGQETFSVVLNTPSGATIATGAATTTIADNGTGLGGSDDDTPAVGSVSRPTVVEGNNLDFTVTLTNPSTTPTPVTLTPASGTATLGTDTQPALVSFDGGVTFSPVAGPSVNVPAGATSFIVRVPTVNDNLAEPTETMTLAASTPANAAPVTGTGTITDNDAPVLSLAGPAVVDEAAGTATYTVTLSNPSSTTVTVNYATADAGATAGADYVAANGTLTFAPGETTKTVVVSITNDNVLEHSESLTMNLAAPSGATLAAGATSVTTAIVDDGRALPGGGTASDDTPSLSVAAVSVAEGAPAVFTVTLSNPSTSAVVFTPSLASGSATLGTDTAAPAALEQFNGTAWVPVTGNVTIAAGATSVQLRLATTDDTISEPNESFTLTATPVSGSTPAAASGAATIVDNDGAPQFSINDVTVNEGAGTITFTVSLSNPAAGPVSVGYATAAGSASLPDDVAAGTSALSGTLNFAAGVTSQTVTLNIVDDNVFEGSETFTINLSNPTGGTLIADGQGIGTIRDDGTGPGGSDNDTPQVGSVSSPTVIEGGNLDFAVTLTHPSTTPTTVTLTPASGSATLGADTQPALVSFDGGSSFVAVVGATVSVPAGATSFIVRVPTVNDTLGEPTETMTLAASTPANAAPVTGTGTITDNDTPVVSITGPALIDEAAGTATFTVTLSNPSSTAVTVGYGTANGTATAGSDYTAASGTLTFAPNETTKTITVAITDDTVFEGSETLTVALSAPNGATLGTAAVTSQIVDDGRALPGGPADNDAPAVGSVSSLTVAEGGNLDFTVALTNPSTTPTTVTLTPASGTATLGTDTNPALVSFDGGLTFSPVTGPTVSVPAGATSFIVRVPTVNDTLGEPSETITLAANTPANAAPVTGTGTITDNDTPVVSVSGPVTYNEAAGTATYTVTLSNPATTAVSVNYATANGTATAGSDYTAASGTLNFAPGETSKTVTVAITNDVTFEGPETFSLNLSAPSGATLGSAASTTTITDDGSGIGGTDNDAPAIGTVSSPTVVEGGNLDFAVTLTHPSTTPTTVSLTPASGTATLGTDTQPALVSFDGGLSFTAVSGPTVSVPAGVTNFIVRVPTVNDTLGEPAETMTLQASTPVNTTPVTGTGTITDNDTPVVSVSGPVTYNEAAGTATYTVTLSNPATTAVSVNYATANGSATAGADYTAATGTLTFAPGTTTQTVTVAITNDASFEGPETFSLNLSAPSGATLGTATSTTTITDDGSGIGGADDDRPAVGAVSSPTVVEGGNLDFTVTLTHPSTTPTTVTLAPASGTATLGTDTAPAQVSFDGGLTFSAVTGPTVTVPAGVTNLVVRVPTVNDTLGEPTEAMTLAASTPANAAPVTGTGTITDNDTPVVSVSGPVTYNEAAGTATYTVTLSNPATTAVSVNYATANGSATAGADYTAASGTLNFAPGETSKTVSVAITNDVTFEGPETFSLNLSAPSGATLGTATSTTTITDDGNGTGGTDNDAPAIGTVSSPTVVEGGNLDFAVTLTHPSTTATTVTLTPASGTATLGTDTAPALVSFDNGATFTAIAGATVSVPAGATSFIVRVPTVDDLATEPSETITLAASTPVNAAPVTGTGTITDNDAPPAQALPAAQATPEDTARVFSSANGNAITVSDPDSATLTTTVSVLHGSLVPGSIAGVTVTGAGTASLQLVGSAAAINAALNGLTYTNAPDYNGPDTMTVATSDGQQPTTTATVAINVTPVADIAADVVTTLEDNAVTIAVNANDSFENAGHAVTAINGIAIAVGGTVAVANGTVTLNADGTLGFTPVANFGGPTTFSYTVTSGGTTETAPVTVNVTPVADKPGLALEAAKTFSIGTNFEEVAGAAGTIAISSYGGGVWQTANSGGTVEIGAASTYVGGTSANRVIELERNPGDPSNLYTDVNVVAGEVYAVNLDYAARSSALASSVIYVMWEGQRIATLNTGSSTFQSFSYNLLAHATGTARLEFVAADQSSQGGLLDNIQFQYKPATVFENSPAHIPTPTGTLVDTDGSETLSYRISNLPVGSIVSDGAHTFTATAGSTVADITGWNLGALTYSAPTGSAGTVTLTYTVTSTEALNGDAASTSQNVVLTVLPHLATPDVVTTNEDTAITFTPLANDNLGAGASTITAINGTGIVAGGSVAVANGSVKLNADGSLVFTPSANYNNTAATPLTFTYTVVNGGTTDTTTVSVVVNPVNDPVIGVADTATAVEAGGVANGSAGTNPSGNVLTNDTDVDVGDTKAVSAVSFGATAGTVGGSTAGNYGTLALNADGTYTYTVNNSLAAVQALRTAANTLTDTFTYTVRDAGGSTSTTSLTVTLQGQNDAPVATVDTGTVTENSNLVVAAVTGVVANDTDVDAGDSKTVSAVSFGAATGTVGSPLTGTYGTLTLGADGSYTYVANRPAAEALGLGQTGIDVFTYTVRDASGATSTATLTLTVNGANDAPVAVVDTATAVESGGTANGTAGVNPTGNVLTNDTDVDTGDTKVVSAITGTAAGTVGGSTAGNYGTLVLNADGSYTYTVNNSLAAVQALRTAANTLTDTFTYTVRDTAGATSTATLTVTVQGANDAPVGVNDTATAVEAGGANNATPGTNPVGNVLTNDTDVDAGDTKTVSAVTGAAAGTVGAATAGAYGSLTLNADGSYSYTVNNALAAVQALRTSANTLTDTFTYTVRDSAGATSTATLNVTVQGANDAPVGVADTATAVEAGGTANGTAGTNPSGNVLANDTDVDAGDSKTVSAITGAAAGIVGGSTTGSYGTLVLNADGSYTYTVNNSLAAVQALRSSTDTLTDTFTYTVRDTAGATSTATLAVTVQGANDAPVGVADNAAATEDATLNVTAASGVLANDTDVDAGDTKAVSAIAFGATLGTVGTPLTGTYGTLTMNADGSYSYLANRPAAEALAAGQTATETFSYTVRDTAGATSTANLTLTITGVNDAPVAANDTATTNEDTAITIAKAALLANDSDVDTGDTLTLTTVQGAVNGTVALAGNNVVFTPNANYSGPASFTYTVTDGKGGTTTGTVNLTVTAVADTPTVSVAAATPVVVFANSWEASPNTSNTSETNNVTTLEGWTRVDTPDAQAGGTNAFEVWTSGDTQQNQATTNNVIVASAGNGEDFLELNDAATLVQTIGVSRSVATTAGMLYELSFDYGGRPGFTTDFTRIGIYIDGVQIQQYAATSPQNYIDWQNLKFHFEGDGAAHTIQIRTDATTFNGAGRGAFLDDMVMTATQGVLQGNGGTFTNVGLAKYVTAGLTDTDGSETLSLKFSGLPTGASIVTAGNATGFAESGGTITISASDLASAQLHLPTSYSGHLSIGVTATATESSNGSTANATTTLELDVAGRLIATDLPGDGLTNVIGTSNAETLTATNVDSYLIGRDGNDTLNGGTANDTLDGGTGNDILNGGAGTDKLWGGTGNDTLTGGTGADTFAWTLADRGPTGTPMVDTITDFSVAAPAAGGDVLDLKDLLVGEYKGSGVGNLQNYLDFDTTSVAGQTTIRISTTGGFANGNYAAGAEDQRITLTGVDLRTGLGLAANATDNQIIQELLNRNKLVVDP